MRTNLNRGVLAILAISLSIAALSANPAQAQDLRIDLSNQVSTTAGNWNNIGSLNTLNAGLIDFNTGAPTSAAILGSAWTDFFGVDTLPEWPSVDWVVSSATQDGAGLISGTGAFAISGLTGSSYKVEVVSARTTFDYLNTITVNGSLANRTFDATPVFTPWGSNTHGLLPQNWLIWDGVVPVSGTINVVDVAGPGTLGIINAIRVSVVPEPTSLALLSLAGLCVVRRRA